MVDIAARFPRLNLRVIHHRPETHFLQRLHDCAAAVESRYVVVHADDDFMRLQGLESCLDFLEAHADYAVAKGRMARFARDKSGKISIEPYIGRTRNENDVHDRLIAHVGNFSPTIYAVHRRRQFVQACDAALKATRNVIFWQYLASTISIIQGKLKTLDDFYYLREANYAGWQATLVANRDREHWPYLAISPEFSRHIRDFRAGTLDFLTEAVGLVPDGFAERLDEALVWLIRHGLCGVQREGADTVDQEVHRRFSDPMSVEFQFFRTCMGMI